MHATSISRFGHHAIFGFSRNPHFLEHKLPERLGIAPHTLDFGRAGRLFWHASYGDVAETETAIAIKLGFVRSPDLAPLSARQLLARKIVSPASIDARAVRGNGLVACFDKGEARFVAYRTLFGTPCLYYAVNEDGVLCSDRLRCLVDLLDGLELDEEAIPQYFLLLSTLGSRTFFRQVQALRPGECLEWRETGPSVRLVKDLRSVGAELKAVSLEAGLPQVYRGMHELVGAYLAEMRQAGAEFGNMLSGGVDSSFTQLLINEHLVETRARTYSYLMHARSFEPEVEYARQAQLAFNTQHTFVDIQPDDYPALLVRSIEILGQPVHSAMEPCRLAMAEFLAGVPNSPRYYFSALGGDRLFGLNMARKIKWLDLASQVPASPLLVGAAGRLLGPLTPRGRSLQKAAQILRDRNHLSAPINTTGISADFGLALDSFGMKTVERIFEHRRAQVLEYLDSSNYQEKAHFAGFIDTTMDEANEGTTFFLAHGQAQVYPFLDEDAFRISLVIRPEERYIHRFRVKPILKQLLEQRSSSPAPRLPKLGSSFNRDVHNWMDRGLLSTMVRAIDRPGFMSKPDLERLIERPNYFFLWAMLTFDIFNKKILKRL